MIVQITATPAMDDATTMRTVMVVFFVDDVVPAGVGVVVADCACPVAVFVIVWVSSVMLTTGVSEVPTGIWEV
jgi:hypothetical protein